MQGGGPCWDLTQIGFHQNPVRGFPGTVRLDSPLFKPFDHGQATTWEDWPSQPTHPLVKPQKTTEEFLNMKKLTFLPLALFGLMMLSPFHAGATESCSARAMCGLTCYVEAPEGGRATCATDTLMVRCFAYDASGDLVQFIAAQCSDCI